MVVLYTDTDTDITLEIAKEYGYKIISMPYTIEGKEYLPYVDFQVFDFHSYYDKLREGVIPTTSAISTQNYIDYFEPEFAAGNDIFYVHFSSAMSHTFDQMNLAYEELKEKYPDRKLYTLDTKAISVLSLGIVLEVADMFHAGKSVEEILEWAKEGIYKRAMYLFADDLDFLKRSGRVSNTSAIVGNLVGIRPMIRNNDEGMLIPCGKERGRIKAINKIVEYMRETGDDVKNYRIIIGHTDAPEYAAELADKIREEFGQDTEIITIAANPTIGAHCGPNTVGVTFHATNR